MALLSAAAGLRFVVGFGLGAMTLLGPGLLIAAWYCLLGIGVWRGVPWSIWVAELANVAIVVACSSALLDWGHLHGGEVLAVLWGAPALLELMLAAGAGIVVLRAPRRD